MFKNLFKQFYKIVKNKKESIKTFFEILEFNFNINIYYKLNDENSFKPKSEKCLGINEVEGIHSDNYEFEEDTFDEVKQAFEEALYDLETLKFKVLDTCKIFGIANLVFNDYSSIAIFINDRFVLSFINDDIDYLFENKDNVEEAIELLKKDGKVFLSEFDNTPFGIRNVNTFQNFLILELNESLEDIVDLYSESTNDLNIYSDDFYFISELTKVYGKNDFKEGQKIFFPIIYEESEVYDTCDSDKDLVGLYQTVFFDGNLTEKENGVYFIESAELEYDELKSTPVFDSNSEVLIGFYLESINAVLPINHVFKDLIEMTEIR